MMRKMIGRLTGRPSFGWSGDYATWESALKNSTGYSDDKIAAKVRDALIQVRDGKAAFERDSVLFDVPEYNTSFLTSLLWAFSKSHGKLTILDFGGSMGSLYFQHRRWLDHLSYTWNVVEQKQFVREGRKHFESDTLKFFESVEDIGRSSPSFLVLSSVLPYLPDPYVWMTKLLDGHHDYVFIDRAPLVEGRDRLTVQKVPKEIYDASYPSWFFNRTRFMKALTGNYNILAEFPCVEKAGFPSEFKGFLLTLKN